jgi:hypothetical protein
MGDNFRKKLARGSIKLYMEVYIIWDPETDIYRISHFPKSWV